MTEPKDTVHSEFAVFVEGVGPVSMCGMPPFRAVVGADEPTVFTAGHDADMLATKVGMEYERLGVPGMGEKIRVYVRTVRTTRGGWNSGLPVHPLAGRK